MTDRPPEDDDGEDDRRGAHGGSWISTLIDALERLEDRSQSRRSRLDYGVSIRSGLEGLANRDDGGDGGRTSLSGRPSGSPGADRAERSGRPRRRRSGDDDYHVSTRTYGDEVIITADLSGADPDDVTVGFDDDSTLVVGVADREVERVRVPWTGSTAEAVVRNGMLTVSVEPEEDAGESTESDDPAGSEGGEDR